jgi:hypothetical protein
MQPYRYSTLSFSHYAALPLSCPSAVFFAARPVLLLLQCHRCFAALPLCRFATLPLLLRGMFSHLLPRESCRSGCCVKGIVAAATQKTSLLHGRCYRC